MNRCYYLLEGVLYPSIIILRDSKKITNRFEKIYESVVRLIIRAYSEKCTTIAVAFRNNFRLPSETMSSIIIAQYS